ncbi:MAG TPA: hypothetical protein HPP77_09380 [Candidatus Hydrogenedentes bacterium]|nr:hypothetical protein [Candidatus Hydrogenedentota bacterium]HIJ73572.1 hypothetical protein [Candidatus Hydrogenedentota bacterium]
MHIRKMTVKRAQEDSSTPAQDFVDALQALLSIDSVFGKSLKDSTTT